MVSFKILYLYFVKRAFSLKVTGWVLLFCWSLIFTTACKEKVQFDESALLSSGSSLPAPNPPTNLSVDISSSSSLFLSWTSGGGTTASYQVAYQVGFSPPSSCNVGSVQNTNLTTLTLTGLTAGKAYSIRVCAKNSKDDLDSSGGITSSATPSAYCTGTKLTDIPFANSSSGGDGLNAGSAFKICTATQLVALSSNSANWGYYFQLENNIDLTGVTNEPHR